MIKRFILSIAILVFSAAVVGCGGGGTGTSSAPPGNDAGVPSVIKLLPAKVVALTNSSVTLNARILDGNGAALANVTVGFTKISGTGVLSAITAITNSNGMASVVITSQTAGFSSVMAEVASGAGLLRDTKTVYFSSAASLSELPAMVLDVDGDDDGIYNEPGDFILFENANDAQVLIRARLSSSLNLGGQEVTFKSDNTTAATFPDGEHDEFKAVINSNNEAFVLVKFTSSFTSSVVNINATASNGSFNMVSLFLEPVTISSVVITANPATVASAGLSTISAFVTTNTGDLVPDGTTVTFTSTAGALSTPFAQTTDGVATTTFTAPTRTPGSSDLTVSVTASAGGKSGSASVTVTASAATLAISPGSASVLSSTGGGVPFTITGGTGPYTTFSSNPAIAYNSAPGDGVWTGSSITVNIPPGAIPGTVTLTVTDSVGATKTATITIVDAGLLTVAPLFPIVDGTDGGKVSFSVTGGTAPYFVEYGCGLPATVICDSTDADCDDSNDSNVWNTSSTFEVTIPPGTAPDFCSIEVWDSAFETVLVSLKIN